MPFGRNPPIGTHVFATVRGPLGALDVRPLVLSVTSDARTWLRFAVPADHVPVGALVHLRYSRGPSGYELAAVVERSTAALGGKACDVTLLPPARLRSLSRRRDARVDVQLAARVQPLSFSREELVASRVIADDAIDVWRTQHQSVPALAVSLSQVGLALAGCLGKARVGDGLLVTLATRVGALHALGVVARACTTDVPASPWDDPAARATGVTVVAMTHRDQMRLSGFLAEEVRRFEQVSATAAWATPERPPEFQPALRHLPVLR